MNIQNIQIAQGLFRTAEERLNSRKDASLPQVNVPDATVGNSKASGDGSLTEVVYPPFFPIGNTQDILLIEGVKQMTGGNAKSQSSASLEEQKAIKQQENSKTDSPDVNEVNAKAPQVKHDVNPGDVLNLTV